jgi:RNA polymerase sigma-70 factor (ECF subfamily)
MPGGADEQTSSTLLERARRQDPLAWGRLVDLYTPLVWRWCRRLNVKPDDTEDVCQEVMRAVHRALPAFRRDQPGQSFRAWLRTITRRKVFDQWQKWSPAGATGGSDVVDRLNEVADPGTDTTPELASELELELGVLYRRVVKVIRAECEEKTWTAFSRVVIEDEPVPEVAASLGMSTNAVYLALSRTRKRLRELLHEMGEESPADDCANP